MIIIGLTGPSGSGKGVVAELLAKYKIYSVDTDAVYHRILIPPSSCLDELTAHFGPSVLCPDGSLNRRVLAKIVFGDSRELEILNNITHKYIFQRTLESLDLYRQGGCPAAVVDAPVLFESEFDKKCKCDVTLAVLAEKRTRCERIMMRDNLSQADAAARIEAQKPDDYYESRADYVIRNDGTIGELEPEIKRILGELGIATP